MLAKNNNKKIIMSILELKFLKKMIYINIYKIFDK